MCSKWQWLFHRNIELTWPMLGGPVALYQCLLLTLRLQKHLFWCYTGSKCTWCLYLYLPLSILTSRYHMGCYRREGTNPTTTINPLRSRQNGRHFADDIFKSIFLNENVWIPIKTSLKFVPQGPINNIPALIQIMAWRRPGDKPLFGPMMVRLLTHICVTRPELVGCRPPGLPRKRFNSSPLSEPSLHWFR